MAETFLQTVPILRIFDHAKALEFYEGFLGFTVEWEHHFEPGMPVDMQVHRGSLTLHLSEHHGDACPGSTGFVRMTGVDDFHREILAKNYGCNRPGIEDAFYGARTFQVHDPFGNRIRFNEYPDTEPPA